MRLSRVFGLVAAIAFGSPATALAGPAPGAPAPAFEGATAAGERIALAQFEGRPVVLEWTNHLCPFVRRHYRTGSMQKLQRRLTEAGAVWISVISSGPGKQGHLSPEEALAVATRNASYADHILLDPTGAIGRRYHAKTTPQLYLIGADGTLVYMGAVDDRPTVRDAEAEGARSYLLEAFSHLRSGEAVAVEATQPYGCAIHYAE